MFTCRELSEGLVDVIPQDSPSADPWDDCEWKLHELGHIMTLPSPVWQKVLATQGKLGGSAASRDLNDVLGFHGRLDNKWEIRASALVHVFADLLLEQEDAELVKEASKTTCPMNLRYTDYMRRPSCKEIWAEIEATAKRPGTIAAAKRAIKHLRLGENHGTKASQG